MSSPTQDLQALTRALRGHLARRSAMGDRRIPRWDGPIVGQPAEADPAPPAKPPAQGQPASEQDTPKGPVQSGWGSTPDPGPETAARAEALAKAAAGCPDLPSLRASIEGCDACSLSQSRNRTVFMDGAGPARVMFVGEAPGYHEDQQGVPFVGKAGQLLTDIIEKGMGLPRDKVAIANVLKCRPPDNRDPLPAEKQLCTTWLDRQIELVQPEVLIALGRHAAGHLLGNEEPLSRLRGQVWARKGRKVVATYHPAYLLRSPSEKKECWKDIRLAMAELGLDPPGNQPPSRR